MCVLRKHFLKGLLEKRSVKGVAHYHVTTVRKEEEEERKEEEKELTTE